MSANACTMLHDTARPHDGESAHVPVVNNAPATPDQRLPLAPIVPHDISATCSANASATPEAIRDGGAVYHDVTDHDARSAPIHRWLDGVLTGFRSLNRIHEAGETDRDRNPTRDAAIVPVVEMAR